MPLTTLLITVNLQAGLQCLSPSGLGGMVSDAHSLCALASSCALVFLTKALIED